MPAPTQPGPQDPKPDRGKDNEHRPPVIPPHGPRPVPGHSSSACQRPTN